MVPALATKTSLGPPAVFSAVQQKRAPVVAHAPAVGSACVRIPIMGILATCFATTMHPAMEMVLAMGTANVFALWAIMDRTALWLAPARRLAVETVCATRKDSASAQQDSLELTAPLSAIPNQLVAGMASVSLSRVLACVSPTSLVRTVASFATRHNPAVDMASVPAVMGRASVMPSTMVPIVASFAMPRRPVVGTASAPAMMGRASVMPSTMVPIVASFAMPRRPVVGTASAPAMMGRASVMPSTMVPIVECFVMRRRRAVPMGSVSLSVDSVNAIPTTLRRLALCTVKTAAPAVVMDLAPSKERVSVRPITTPVTAPFSAWHPARALVTAPATQAVESAIVMQAGLATPALSTVTLQRNAMAMVPVATMGPATVTKGGMGRTARCIATRTKPAVAMATAVRVLVPAIARAITTLLIVRCIVTRSTPATTMGSATARLDSACAHLGTTDQVVPSPAILCKTVATTARVIHRANVRAIRTTTLRTAPCSVMHPPLAAIMDNVPPPLGNVSATRITTHRTVPCIVMLPLPAMGMGSVPRPLVCVSVTRTTIPAIAPFSATRSPPATTMERALPVGSANATTLGTGIIATCNPVPTTVPLRMANVTCQLELAHALDRGFRRRVHSPHVQMTALAMAPVIPPLGSVLVILDLGERIASQLAVQTTVPIMVSVMKRQVFVPVKWVSRSFLTAPGQSS